jgi:hypothetical protein
VSVLSCDFSITNNLLLSRIIAGPPETYDVRERWVYRLLASSRLLLVSRCDLCHAAYRAHADELMSFFITDSTRRVRVAALKSLHVILAKDILTDLRLTVGVRSPSGTSGALSCPRVVLVSDCVALDVHTSFKERLVLYLVRIIGACWSPDLTAGAVDFDDNTQGSSAVGEEAKLVGAFLSFAPTLFSEKQSKSTPLTPPIFTPPALLAGLGDRVAARDTSLGEISYHLVSILRSLATSSAWAAAMKAVVSKILSTASKVVSQPSLWLSLMGLDTLGCAAFLGESTGGPYLGATASSLYSVSKCHILSIHKAMSVAIVMAWNSTHTKRQISTVRLSDLTGFNLPFTFEMHPALVSDIVKLLNALKGFTGAAVSDLLCIFNPQHMTQRHQILRTIRPLEVLMYHQLLRSLAHAPGHLLSTCQALRSQQDLLKFILQTTSRTLPLSDPIKREHTHTDSTIFSLWTASAVYVSSMPKKLTKCVIPLDDPERVLRKYLQDCVGVAVEKFSGPQEVLLRSGMFAEVLTLRSDSGNMKQSDDSADFLIRDSGEGVDGDAAMYSTDWGPVPSHSAATASSSMTSPSMHSPPSRAPTHLLPLSELKSGDEQDSAVRSLQLVCVVRQSIITSSRLLIIRLHDLLNRDTYASFSMPWKMLLWHSFAECSPYSPLPLSPPPSSSSSSSSAALSYHASSLARISPEKGSRTRSSGGYNDKASSLSVADLVVTGHKSSTSSSSSISSSSGGGGGGSVRAGCSSIVRVMFSELNKMHKHVTSLLASNLLVYLTSIKSKGEGERGSEGDALDACDFFPRILNSVWVWLRLLEGTREEAEVCFEFLRIILPSLVAVHGHSDEHSVLLMKVCPLGCLFILCYLLPRSVSSCLPH